MDNAIGILKKLRELTFQMAMLKEGEQAAIDEFIAGTKTYAEAKDILTKEYEK